MFVSGLGTANPPRRYTKSECWEAFKSSEWFLKLDRRSHMIAETVLTKDNGIDSRWLALDSLNEVFRIDPDTLHRRFLTNAPALGANAGKRALDGSRSCRQRHRWPGYQHLHRLSLSGPYQLRRRASRTAFRCPCV